MTHPTRAFSGSIINRFTGSKILARVGQISVAFPLRAHGVFAHEYDLEFGNIVAMEETVVLVFHLDVVEGERGGGLVPLCRTAAEGDGGVSVVHLSAKPH